MDKLFMQPTFKIVMAQVRRKPLPVEVDEVHEEGKVLDVEQIEKR